MNNYRGTQYKVLILAALVQLMAAVPANAERREYYGISPAYPKSSQIPPFAMHAPILRSERTFQIVLEIDQKGIAKKAVSQFLGDSLFAQYVLSSISQMPFEPAVRNDTKVNSLLPIIFTRNPSHRLSLIEFPVDSALQITRRQLYFNALEQNGLVLPRLKKFPPYFCDLRPQDSPAIPPFVLLSLILDETGEVGSCEIAQSNYPAFASQIQSAALWSAFSPLFLNENAAISNCFLLVLLLPQLQYPTRAIESGNDSAAKWYDNWRVQVIPDTVGLMLPPIPKEENIKELFLPGENKYVFGKTVAKVAIDSLGRVKFKWSDTKNPKLNGAVLLALKDVSLFPAINYHGAPVEFEGSIYFTFDNRTSVRVKYHWLETD